MIFFKKVLDNGKPILYNKYRKTEREDLKMTTVVFNTKSTKALRNWFKANGFPCGCGLLTNWENLFHIGFCFDPEVNRVKLPRSWECDFVQDNFLDYLKTQGLTTDANWLAMTILHEVGHAHTLNLFNERELKATAKAKKNISTCRKYNDLLEANLDYWALPVEDLANKWAITYANTFPKKTERLGKLLLRHCVITEG